MDRISIVIGICIPFIYPIVISIVRMMIWSTEDGESLILLFAAIHLMPFYLMSEFCGGLLLMSGTVNLPNSKKRLY